ncbi:hypothetical protein IHE45_05G088400 [Dioscorea alata]|uniref:Uncharacterized protein n=1 Tax=Dioscorea alata TaxID=55571 RepID=A0ACB7W3C9_DIOAL|nr:hypothetical protein IHE45_05G088400 [Dioscorea alata]
MTEGMMTRARPTDEQLTFLSNLIAQQDTKIDFMHASSVMADMMLKLAKLKHSPPQPPLLPLAPPATSPTTSFAFSTMPSTPTILPSPSFNHLPKLEIPLFFSDDVLGWLFQANQFFTFHQSSTVKYLADFECLSSCVLGHSQANILNCFLFGLRPDIQRELYMLRQTILHDAISLAKLVKNKHNDARAYIPQSHFPFFRPPPAPHLPTTGSNRYAPLPIKCLTPSEMATRREKGLCFNCDAKFVPGHKCNPPQFLCLIKVVVFIDGGSTNNLIQSQFACHLALPIQTSPQLRVTVGNCDSVDCSGTCHQVPLKLSEASIAIDLILLPLYGADLVLGIQWLLGLGPV